MQLSTDKKSTTKEKSLVVFVFSPLRIQREAAERSRLIAETVLLRWFLRVKRFCECG